MPVSRLREAWDGWSFGPMLRRAKAGRKKIMLKHDDKSKRSHHASGALPSGDAALEARADILFRQFAADEHDAARARLVAAPIALMIAVKDHMDALEDEALRIVLERKDAL